MKILEPIDLKTVLPEKKTKGVERLNATHRLVEEMWPKFKALLEIKTGVPCLPLSIVEPSDEPGRFPSLAEYRRDAKLRQGTYYPRVRERVHLLMQIIRRRGKVETKWRYQPMCMYIGDGKVALFWKYKPNKMRKLKESSDGPSD